MRAGQMYRRVKFFAKTTVRDDYGSTTDTYDYAKPTITTRGELRYTGGSKTLQNEEKHYSKSIELIIRYVAGITETMHVQIDDTTDLWLINYIEPIGRNEGLRLNIDKSSESIIL